MMNYHVAFGFILLPTSTGTSSAYNSLDCEIVKYPYEHTACITKERIKQTEAVTRTYAYGGCHTYKRRVYAKATPKYGKYRKYGKISPHFQTHR